MSEGGNWSLNESRQLDVYKRQEGGCIIPFELYDSITSSLDPGLRQQILDGQFETVVCPDCRAVSYIQYDILYHDPARRFMVCVGTDYSEDV